MPEEKTTPPADDTKTTALTIGEITSLIVEKIKDQLPGKASGDGKSTQDGQPGPSSKVDIAGQVKAELEKLSAREAAQKKDDDVQNRLAALEKPKQEKTPIERSRVHKIMGWGENV